MKRELIPQEIDTTFLRTIRKIIDNDPFLKDFVKNNEPKKPNETRAENLMKEYELIKQKKSQLSAKQRRLIIDAIENPKT